MFKFSPNYCKKVSMECSYYNAIGCDISMVVRGQSAKPAKPVCVKASVA